jgi:hypothetical protein
MNMARRDKRLSMLLGENLSWTDMSKYDRTMGTVCRYMEELLVIEFSHPDDVEESVQALRCIINGGGNHVDGIRVRHIGAQRRSGEPFTSIMNAFYNLYHSWIACPCNRCFWELCDLIVIEGDDKIDGINTPQQLLRAADVIGLNLKVEYVGDITCGFFLGRCHGFDSNGKMVSMCDFWRTLKKFHLSSRPPGQAGNDQLLLAKCLSYLSTDYRTPAIGMLAWSLAQRLRTTTPVFTKEQTYRLEHGNISITDMLNSGPPVLDDLLTAQYAYINNVPLNLLITLHNAYRDGYYPQIPNDLDTVPTTYSYVP